MFYGRFNDPTNGEFLNEAIARFRRIFASVFAMDNVILFDRTLGFRHDPKFMDACRRNARNAQERSLLLRLNTLVWAATNALHVPGDFVECGVWRGYCSAVIADYLDFNQINKKFYLYDTFSGIPPDYDSEHHDSPGFREEGLYESVVERFSKFANVQIVRGVVPDSFTDALPETVAFMHLDMNSSKSEIAALETLFNRLSIGGIIILDDYGWLGYEAQQRAEDLFMKARGQRILELPSGQGLLIKQA